MSSTILRAADSASPTATVRTPRRQGSLPPQKQVLILGARGRLGYACVQAFAQAGWKVLAHVRADCSLLPASGQGLEAQVRWINAPIDQPQAFKCFGDIHVVINAMAPKFTLTDWRRNLPMLTQASIEIARALQAVLVHPLSVVPYGNPLPHVLMEGSMPAAKVSPLISELRAHTELQLYAGSYSGVRVCTLRLGTLYGHTGWGWISTAVAKHIKEGQVDWLGPYDIATPWAYAPDVAQTMERIANQSDLLGYWTPLHFAGHLRTGQEWLQALQTSCHQLHWLPAVDSLKARKILWPWWQPVGLVSSSVRALCMMEYIWRTPHRLDNQHLHALIGPEPRTDWQRSVQQTLELLDRQDHLHGGLIRTMQGY